MMPTITRYLFGALIAAVVVFLVWYFSDIVAYILISAVLAIIGKPIVDAMERIKVRGRKFPRWLAALSALLFMWFVAALLLRFLLPMVFGKLSELAGMDSAALTEAFSEPLKALQDWLMRMIPATHGFDFSFSDEISGHFSSFFNLEAFNNALRSGLSFVSHTVIALFSVTFITFFFLKQENLFQNMLVALFPKRHEAKIIHALNSTTKLLIRYFTGILAESGIIMLLLSVIFLLWGFAPNTALFMAFFMGLLNVIPYIGPIIGAMLCVLVGVISPLEGATLGHTSLIIVGSILVVKGLDDFVLQPSLYSNRVKAHPLEIFLVILIAGNLGGVLGMLFAIPGYTVIRVFAKEFFNQFPIVQKLTENLD